MNLPRSRKRLETCRINPKNIGTRCSRMPMISRLDRTRGGASPFARISGAWAFPAREDFPRVIRDSAHHRAGIGTAPGRNTIEVEGAYASSSRTARASEAQTHEPQDNAPVPDAVRFAPLSPLDASPGRKWIPCQPLTRMSEEPAASGRVAQRICDATAAIERTKLSHEFHRACPRI